jgi:1,4-dihydroxy-6-naphthoate synthase
MQRAKQLSIAYQPASHDAARYFALQTGRVEAPGYEFKFHTDPIEALDRAARERHFDITAISATAYAELADDYRILSVGTSVGRDCGPVLVSQHYFHIDQLQFRRVGVAGVSTTGGCLLKWACPDALLYELPSDKIAAAVANGQLDAGVLIDELSAFCRQSGLHKVVDLGKLWANRTNLPLPIDLNVISRRIRDAEAAGLCELLHESLCYSQKHRAEALNWASRFDCGPETARGPSQAATLANTDLLSMAEDVRLALGLLLPLVKELGLSNCDLPALDIVEKPTRSTTDLLTASAA